MAVPLLDLNTQNQAHSDALKLAFERVVGSSQFILGHEVASFEKSVAQRLGSEHAIGVSSGTDALLLALMALEIGSGDEVLCPSYTFFATAGCIARLGAIPVFIDVHTDSFNLDVTDAASKITLKTKAILPVHLYGQSADMGAITELAQEHRLKIVEDCAQSMGARWKADEVGTIGDFGTYSFFPTKNLGGFGDGGMLVTNDADLAEKARVLRVHGSKPKYYHKLLGGNFRLDALQASLLAVKLGSLNRFLEQRRANAAYYIESFKSKLGQHFTLILPSEMEHCWHTWNQFTIRVADGKRDALREHLKQNNIASEIYYPLSLHQQECFQGLPAMPCPVSEQLAQECLSLPIYPELSREMQDEVVVAVTDFL